jgi:hypothetical protein
VLSLASGPFAFLAVGQDARAADAPGHPPPGADTGTETGAVASRPARVGDATAGLLALQRDGTAASPVPRPITGEVATRSYQRYLRSFEQAIPERLGGSVSGGTSSVGAGR